MVEVITPNNNSFLNGTLINGYMMLFTYRNDEWTLNGYRLSDIKLDFKLLLIIIETANSKLFKIKNAYACECYIFSNRF